MTKWSPYQVEERGGYWIVVDTRTFRAPASYPTDKRTAEAECETLSRVYWEAMEEENRLAKERMLRSATNAKAKVEFEPDADGIQMDESLLNKIRKEVRERPKQTTAQDRADSRDADAWEARNPSIYR